MDDSERLRMRPDIDMGPVYAGKRSSRKNAVTVDELSDENDDDEEGRKNLDAKLDSLYGDGSSDEDENALRNWQMNEGEEDEIEALNREYEKLRSEEVEVREWMERRKLYLECLEKVTNNPKVEQERLLEHILKKNASSLYLQQFGLNGATDVHTFRNLVPVCDYEGILPYVERIIQGDKAPFLSCDPVIELIASTGTSGGQPKLYPITAEEKTLRAQVMDMHVSIFNRIVAKQEKGKSLPFNNIRPGMKTPGGLLSLANTTSILPATLNNVVLQNLTSPKEVFLASEFKEATYCHLLCGFLRGDEVVRIFSIFAAVLVRSIQYLEECWPDICEDMAKGTLNKTKVRDDSVRAAVLPYLRVDPGMAERIRRECSNKSWKGIVRRLWPNCEVLDTTCTGSMAAYIPVLNHYTDNLPLRSTVYSCFYACSEGFFGVNMDPKCPAETVSHVLLPTTAYYEFISLTGDRQQDNHKDHILDLSSVKEGQEYEILVTTVYGLCRYRIGDVLKVVGFYNATPKFQFVRREGTVLSVDEDKTDAGELLLGVTRAAELLADHLGLTLVDYTSMVDLSTSPPHYVIFLELNNDGSVVENISSDILEKCCVLVESSFDAVYNRSRFENFVGPLELRIVQKKTFEKVAALAFLRGVTPAQFKTPPALGPKHSHYLEVLTNGLIQQYICQSCPANPDVELVVQ